MENYLPHWHPLKCKCVPLLQTTPPLFFVLKFHLEIPPIPRCYLIASVVLIRALGFQVSMRVIPPLTPPPPGMNAQLGTPIAPAFGMEVSLD